MVEKEVGDDKIHVVRDKQLLIAPKNHDDDNDVGDNDDDDNFHFILC